MIDPEPTPEPLYISTRDAAALIGLAPATLETWRSRARGPRYRKIGGRVVYSRAEVIAYAEANARSSTAEAAA